MLCLCLSTHQSQRNFIVTGVLIRFNSTVIRQKQMIIFTQQAKIPISTVSSSPSPKEKICSIYQKVSCDVTTMRLEPLGDELLTFVNGSKFKAPCLNSVCTVLTTLNSQDMGWTCLIKFFLMNYLLHRSMSEILNLCHHLQKLRF